MKIGATNDYPEGKLNKHDEGGLQFAIFHNKGKVHVEFGKPVAWFALGPEQARQLAGLLIQRASQAEKDYQ